MSSGLTLALEAEFAGKVIKTADAVNQDAVNVHVDGVPFQISGLELMQNDKIGLASLARHRYIEALESQ